jgi:hypothetical protein
MSELTVIESGTKGHDLAKLEPKKMELEALVGMCRGLVINGIDDKDTYKLVDEYRKKLVKARTGVIAIGDELKEEAKNWVKAVNEKVKDLVEIVQPVEKQLASNLAAIDQAKEMADRKAMIPVRKEDLLKVGVEATDEFLMEMDSTKYNSYLKLSTENYLAAQAKQIADQEAKLKAAQDAIVKQQEALDRAAKAKVEEEERLKKQHEFEMARAQEDAEIKAKQEVEDALRRERAAELLNEAAKEADARKQAQLESRAKYNDWLKVNGYEPGSLEWYLGRDGNIVRLYKQVAEIDLTI